MAGVEQAGLRDDVEEDLRLLQEDLSEIESDIGRLAQEEMEREGAARLASEAVPPLQRSQKLAEAEVRSLGGRGAAEGGTELGIGAAELGIGVAAELGVGVTANEPGVEMTAELGVGVTAFAQPQTR